MATRSLASARRYYDDQRRLAALTLRAVRRAQGVTAVAMETARYQTVATQLAVNAVAAQVAEQGLTAPAASSLNLGAFIGSTAAGADLAAYLAQAADVAQMSLMAVQQVRDAGNAAHSTAVVVRPALQGHIRYLTPPSCGRCTVLAGRFYRWSTGFLRHPGCDCVMVATNEGPARGLIADPKTAYDKGLVSDLTQAEHDAIAAGADIGQVVNVHRKSAGLTVAGRVFSRGSGRTKRLTPEGIFALASDRANALELLARAGYIRP